MAGLSRKLRKVNFAGYAFVLPATIFYTVFLVVPLFSTVWYSFFEWDGANPKMNFVGLDNYKALLQDEIFWKALGHNIFWIIGSILLPLVLGLVLAMLISLREIKHKLFYRVTFFMPVVLSLTVVSYIWNWMYNPNIGVINSLVRMLGFADFNVAWLGNETLVMFSLLIASCWNSFGFCMVVFLAAMQTLPPEYNEVALIEGANRFQTIRYVTIPSIRNTITLMALNTLIGSFKVFDMIYLLTKGGPYNSSEVISTYMYQNTFILYKVGYGSTIAVALTAVIGVVSIFYLKAVEKGE